MKKWLIAVAVSVLFSSSAFGAGIGGFASRWDAKDPDDTWGFGGLLRFDLNENLQLDLRGSYYLFEDREDDIKGELTVIPAEVALMFKIPLEGQFSAYLGGGLGYYFGEAKLKGGGESFTIDIDDEVGFFALGGIEIKLGDSFSLFGEAKYTWLEFEKAKLKDTGIPELDGEKFDFDLKMDGLAVNIGLLLRF